jgi:RNA polymerase sigma-70 factor (family 1)
MRIYYNDKTNLQESGTDEAELIAQLKEDSEEAFSLIYKLYAARLYAFVKQYVKVRETTEEIVEDAFVWVWRHRHELRQTETLKSLLFLCSKHYIINSWKQTVNSQSYEDYCRWMADRNEEGTTQQLDYDDFMTQLRTQMMKLPDTQRKVIELSRLKQKTIKEIAAELQLSEQTVKNQISLGLKALRKNMQPIYGLAVFFMII